MRYVITFVVCAIIAIGAVFVWIAKTVPHGEGAFGIAKIIPFILLIGPPAIFSLIWFPANLGVFLWGSCKQKQPAPGVLSTSAALMIFCLGVIGVYVCRWIPAWKAEREEQRCEMLAAQQRVTLKDVKDLIDRYAAESQRGTYLQPPSRKYSAIRILISNPATPPDVLDYLAGNMDDSSAVLFFVAENSNCPPQLISRFESIPATLPFLASNPQASPEMLQSLSASTNWQVRVRVAQNPNTSRETLEQLLKDSKWSVQDEAKRSIKIRFGNATGH